MKTPRRSSISDFEVVVAKTSGRVEGSIQSCGLVADRGMIRAVKSGCLLTDGRVVPFRTGDWPSGSNRRGTHFSEWSRCTVADTPSSIPHSM